MLKKGARGKEVRELQEKLLSLGYELPKFGADGDFGLSTDYGSGLSGLVLRLSSFYKNTNVYVTQRWIYDLFS